MDNENNQLSDIDAGKLNFQPIPKRFMVWDKGNQKFMYFIDDDGYERFMVDISELYVLIEEYGYSYEDADMVKVVGHILSNPELLRRNNHDGN